MAETTSSRQPRTLQTPQTLQAIIDSGTILGPAVVARLVAAVGAELVLAHADGTVQGGLDPAHVVVHPQGHISLLPWSSEVIGGRSSSTDVAALMSLAADLIADAPVPAAFARFVMGKCPQTAVEAVKGFESFASISNAGPVGAEPEATASSDAGRSEGLASPVASRLAGPRAMAVRRWQLPNSDWFRPSWLNWRLGAAVAVLLLAVGVFVVPAVFSEPVIGAVPTQAVAQSEASSALAIPTPRAMPTPPPAAPVDWKSVLTQLDDARSGAFASAVPGRLAAVNIPGSEADLHDRQLMGELTRLRARAVGLTVSIEAVTELAATDRVATVQVTDWRAGYQVVSTLDGKVLKQRPARATETWIIDLANSESGWRINAVAPAG